MFRAASYFLPKQAGEIVCACVGTTHVCDFVSVLYMFFYVHTYMCVCDHDSIPQRQALMLV